MVVGGVVSEIALRQVNTGAAHCAVAISALLSVRYARAGAR